MGTGEKVGRKGRRGKEGEGGSGGVGGLCLFNSDNDFASLFYYSNASCCL